MEFHFFEEDPDSVFQAYFGMHTCPSLNCISELSFTYTITINSASDGSTTQEEWLANDFIKFEPPDGNIDAYKLTIREYNVWKFSYTITIELSSGSQTEYYDLVLQKGDPPYDVTLTWNSIS